MAHSSHISEPPPRPPLRSLEVAVAVAHCGSLTAAAAVLGMTHGAVSRHVRTVEDWVNLRLFERHGRGVSPTQEGHIFFNQVERGFALIDRAADRWQRRRGRDVVRLSTTPTFAKFWLLPRIRRIESVEPPIHIDLAAQQGLADIEKGEVDVAIRYSRRERLPDAARVFMTERLFPVAAPELAEEIGAGDVGRLLAHPLLHDTDAAKWRAWCEAAVGQSYSPRARDRRFEDYPLCLAAAEAGLGVALAQCPLIDEVIGGLNLVRLPFPEAQSPLSYFFLFAPGSLRPAVARLVERLVAEVGAGQSEQADAPAARRAAVQSG
ncbi:Glycine cleavage system transcriptional activator [Defluviimonas aquaemixtae]|uniref:Glycine cleavage system transcriptional activator n=1 Tax=Albidovulum aquaemixtae TaxID=1542388 RepID=A0A2R8B1X9_9RHOB|nr:LysR substrate-binding domain-containing protein [Defluviimonas aquaemixtae]SPH16550.1 Glycine cleavage system transcriptional activator [Defluviimonas aquaemixtae]